MIFLSALHETEDKVQGFKLGAVDFVAKPYQPDEVLARVRTHIELRRLQTGLEERVRERTADYVQSEKKLQESHGSSCRNSPASCKRCAKRSAPAWHAKSTMSWGRR